MANIVITAVDTLTSSGLGKEALLNALKGDVKVSEVSKFDSHSLEEPVPAHVVDVDFNDILGKKGLRTKDKATKMLLSLLEVSHAEWLEKLDDASKPGLMVGTGFGSVESVGNFITDAVRTGPSSVNPRLFGNTVINSPAGNANIRFGLKNLSGTMTTGFNSGLDSLIWSADFIKNGYLESVFAATLEELSIYTIWGMEREGCLSKSGKMNIFSKDADGVVLGEACAVALLESAESASKRGATVIAEILGMASGFEPNSGEFGFSKSGETATEVIKMALADASLSASDIDVVVSDANGQVDGDIMRAAAIAATLPQTPVVSYKPYFGETYGASGGVDLAAVICDMERGELSPALNSDNLFDGFAVVTEPKKGNFKRALLTSFSVDGHCSALIIEKK